MAILTLALVVGILRYETMDRAGRAFLWIIAMCYIEETAALAFDVAQGNNHEVYDLFDLVQLFFVMLYFREFLAFLRTIKAEWIVAICFVGIALFHYRFGPDLIVDSYVLMVTGITTILLCFLSLLQLLKSNVVNFLSKNPHFWFISVLLFFWSCNLIQSILLKNPKVLSVQYGIFMSYVSMISNVLVFSAIGLVFFNYPKYKLWKRSHLPYY